MSAEIASDLSVQWRDSIAQFQEHLVGEGRSPATSVAQAQRLTRFARAVVVVPWDVTTEMVSAWLALPGRSAATVKLNRSTLRMFYRWAVTQGLLPLSPVPERVVSRYQLVDRWQDALAAFELDQGRRQVSPATIAARLKYITRFAHEYAGEPWAATSTDVHAWLDAVSGTTHTRSTMRTALRAFYGWAYRAGHVSVDPTAEASRRAVALPIPELWRDPIASYARAARAAGNLETTIETRRSTLGRFARSHASLSPWDVTLHDALEWMGAQRWAPETRRLARSALMGFYRWAEDTGRVEESPLARFPIVKASYPRARVALDRDYAAALQRASASDALALRLSAELGLRRGEVAQIHSTDVYTAGGQAFLRVHGKGNRERTLPVTAGLAAQLLALPQGYIFPGEFNGHVSPRWLGRRISQLLPPGVTMHMLRHRFATLAYGATGDLLTVQRLLGHSSPATTQRYVQLRDTQLRAAVEAVAGVQR